MIYSHGRSSDLFSILGLNDLQFLVLGLIHFAESSFLWRTAKTIFAQSNSPTPLNKAPGSFKLPLKHVCWEGGGGGKKTMHTVGKRQKGAFGEICH